MQYFTNRFINWDWLSGCITIKTSTPHYILLYYFPVSVCEMVMVLVLVSEGKRPLLTFVPCINLLIGTGKRLNLSSTIRSIQYPDNPANNTLSLPLPLPPLSLSLSLSRCMCVFNFLKILFQFDHFVVILFWLGDCSSSKSNLIRLRLWLNKSIENSNQISR